MLGLMTTGEPRGEPLLIVASAARMNLTRRGRGLLFFGREPAKTESILDGVGGNGLIHA